MLSSYRVIDLTDERGHLAAFIWAQMGADVIAIEPPGGSSARRLAPFAGDMDDPERSLHHWAYNRGKRSIVLDLETDDGRTELRRLIAGADVLFESLGVGVLDQMGLGYEELAALNPALVQASITPFGADGPKADWVATDITIQASAGNMVITGDGDRAPLRAGGTLPQAFHNAASEAAGAALIALYERQSRSGLGQYIDLSAQQSMNQCTQSMSLATPLGGTPPVRTSGGVSLQGIDIQLMWPCADGYASVSLLFGTSFGPFTQNLMDWVHEDGFCDEATRAKPWTRYTEQLLSGEEPVAEYDRVKQVLTDFFATKTKDELLTNAISRRLLITPITTTADVVDSEQLAFRRYWEDVDQGEADTVRYPGAFAKFSETPLRPLGPPPRIGEHTAEVAAEPLRQPVVAVGQPVASTDLPLKGLKVLDFMWAMAGPAASRVLADYGAEIVRVESEHKIDAVRTLQPFPNDVPDPELSGIYNNMNAGKKGLSLDMSKPGATDIIWDLIDWADVVLESFSPRAMKEWGLGYEAVRARRPDIIMASSCLMGQTGPVARLAGFGTMASAISGFFYPVGWTDRAPCGPYSAYTDYTSPRWLVASIMGALEHRRATGQGQYIDLSQAEAALHLMGPALLERTVNGRIWERAGNRDMAMAPHGAYATVGDDCWIAIACVNDDQWAALSGAMGADELVGLSTAERHTRHDELDERIEAWTSSLDGDELMVRLQELGVAAHIMQHSPELVADPQLVHRGQFVAVEHGKADQFFVDGSRFRFSRTPAAVTHAGPCYGEHTFEVLTDILGYGGDRIAELAGAELLE
ncbi:MAG: CoA transferase [Actinomycetia bacterium]|nr:CoA transferase [Actinomycetes bacterium]